MSKKITTDENNKKIQSKKTFYKKWWFWVIVVIILVGVFGNSNNSSNSSEKSSHHSSTQSSKVINKDATDQIKKIKAENLEIGMSKEDVIKKLGKPIDDSDGLLTYHGFNLYFENNKLIGGDNLPKLEKKAYKAVQERKQSEKDKQQKIESFAQSFGQEPVEEMQKKTMVYPSQRVGNNMMYSWKPDKNMPTYIRVDDEHGFTTVYLYDQNAKDGLGQLLYRGKTIMQNNKRPVIVY